MTAVEGAASPRSTDAGTAEIGAAVAAPTETKPAPSRSVEASTAPAESENAGTAVSIRADFSWAGVHAGCCWRSSATAPATAGEAIDVPSQAANFPCGSDDTTITPGAERSGLSRWSNGVGPDDENDASTLGATATALVVLPSAIRTRGPETIAARRLAPTPSAIITPGTASGSAISKGVPGRLLTTTMPIAPACAACFAFTTNEQTPRSTSMSDPAGTCRGGRWQAFSSRPARLASTISRGLESSRGRCGSIAETAANEASSGGSGPAAVTFARRAKMRVVVAAATVIAESLDPGEPIDP